MCNKLLGLVVPIPTLPDVVKDGPLVVDILTLPLLFGSLSVTSKANLLAPLASLASIVTTESELPLLSISNLESGEVVPIPTLPLELMRIRSVSLVFKTIGVVSLVSTIKLVLGFETIAATLVPLEL